MEQVSGPCHPRLAVNLLGSTWGLFCSLWGVSEPLPLDAQPCMGGLVIIARSKALGTRLVTSQVPFFGLMAILCALYLRLRVCRHCLKAISWTKPQALRWDGQQERSGMELAEGSGAFFALCPVALGTEGACHRWARWPFAAGCVTFVGEHRRVTSLQQLIFFFSLLFLHGLHSFSAWPFQRGEQFGYTLPTRQSVL